ncbi:membrane protein [Geotalea uraniireducens]|uniref:Membrane protein n=1 Tax=Geotalea uraniireducens TaxID=351604 RepID=A0ABM8EPT2_9BACT|nr:hypothetical protein [Geotalea uraniireducens]BDV44623.1 membrane protein [Geotalea uraniireducens]
MAGLVRRIVALLVALPLLLAVTAAAAEPVTLYFFWGEGCPHCARAKPFLAELAKRHPALQVRDYEVLQHRENLELLLRMSRQLGEEATGVPTIILAGRMYSGFSPETARQLETRVATLTTPRPTPAPCPPDDSLAIPFFGRVDSRSLSLPAFTVVVAGLDSFNPCAFFVLFFLLSLLTHVHSRRRMLLLGGVFVFFSGLVYFLFMAAWLNLFILVGNLPAITVGAGLLAIVIALLNIKDFFFFEEGVSLVIPEGVKPRLFERMREIVRAGALPAMLASTVVLAVAANTYELLCTAGFPMVFTRVLTLHRLSTGGYYLYLAFYNLVYVVPLAVIVGLFVVTLGSRKLSEWQGRLLKLISGSMMLCLGAVLLIRPALLNNALVSLLLLAAALLGAGLTVVVARRVRPERFGNDG